MLKQAREASRNAAQSIKNSVLVKRNEFETFNPDSFDKILFVPNYFTDVDSFVEFLSSQADISWNKVGGRLVEIFGGIYSFIELIDNLILGVPHPNGSICAPFPIWLQSIAQDLSCYFNFEIPNQVLLNCYDESEGMISHFALFCRE
jgi:hypothetical protein